MEEYYKFKYFKYKKKYLELKNNNLLSEQIGGTTNIKTNSYEPVDVKEFYIYDIFHNDIGQYVIISPGENKPLTIKLKINDKLINFNLEKCPHRHTYIYYCNYNKYFDKITLIFNYLNEFGN